MTERLTPWQVVLQSQVIHPDWTTDDHAHFLMDEGYDISHLGVGDESTRTCIDRWLRENNEWPGGPAARAGAVPATKQPDLCQHGNQSCGRCVREAVARANTAHEDWKEMATRAAHHYADQHDLCEAFDDFMVSIGLEPRTREYEVTVRVSFDVKVTVEATRAEDAEDAVDWWEVREEARRYLQHNDIDNDCEITDVEKS